MTAIQIRPNQQQDAAAIYIHERLANHDRLEKEAKVDEQLSAAKHQAAKDELILAGVRLIKQQSTFTPDNSVSGVKLGRPKNPFLSWLDENNIPRTTATRLIKQAGQSVTEREADDAAESARKKASRDAKAAEESKGWRIEAITAGLLKQGFDGNVGKKVRIEIAEYLGNGVTEKTVKNQPQSELHRACVAIAIMRDPDAAKQKTEDEVKTLPEKMQVKFERLLNARVFQIETDFWNKVNETVEKRVAEEVKEAKETKERYEGLIKPLHGIMSKNDFRTVLSCLASDRYPEDQRSKYDHATAIFNKLKPKIKW